MLSADSRSLRRVAQRVNALWRVHARTIDWIVLAVGALGAIWLAFHPRAPGYAIGLLAFVAAVMTFSRPTGLQRAAVILLAGALYFVEIHAIDKDHSDQQAAVNAIIAQGHADTNRTIDNANAAFGEAERNISGVGKLARGGLAQISGEGSYAYVMPIVSNKGMGGIVS